MIRMLGDSARWASPGCKLVLLTDSKTRIDSDLPWDVKRYDLPTGTKLHGVNHHRMAARSWFARSAPPGDYIFCDYDVLLVKIPPIDFDMGITLRKRDGMKVQEGVMYCGNIKAAAEYFGYIYDRMCDGTDAEQHDWGGSQVAAMVLLEKLYASQATNPVVWAGWKIQMLNCQDHNHSPATGEGLFAWHFKGGSRKWMMQPYYDHMKELSDGLRKTPTGNQDDDARAVAGIVSGDRAGHQEANGGGNSADDAARSTARPAAGPAAADATGDRGAGDAATGTTSTAHAKPDPDT